MAPSDCPHPYNHELAQEDERTEIERKAEQIVVEGPAEYFTGKVTPRGQFKRDAPSRVTGAIMHFDPRGRLLPLAQF